MSWIILFHHISFLATILYLSQNLNNFTNKTVSIWNFGSVCVFQISLQFQKEFGIGWIKEFSFNILLHFWNTLKTENCLEKVLDVLPDKLETPAFSFPSCQLSFYFMTKTKYFFTDLNLIATWICHDENRQISVISACHIPTDR